MTFWQAVVLGIVQGATEFLPISSTAHLRIIPALCGWSDPGAAFTAVIQVGTLAAVVWYFRRDVWSIALDACTNGPRARWAWMMLIGTLPIVLGGLLFKHHIETSLRSLYVISASLIGLALVLWLAERVARHQRAIDRAGWLDAIVVGCAQAVALIPGSSRSGVTITAALFRGFTRESAARFSFLLSLPAVGAAGGYELYREHHALLASRGDALPLLTATLVSAAVGYAAIAFLLNYLKTRSTYLFIVYRLALGAVLLVLLWSGRLAAQ